MKKILIIVSVILCTCLAHLKNININNYHIELLGTNNQSFVSVDIKNNEEFDRLAKLSNQNSLSLLRIDYDKDNKANYYYNEYFVDNYFNIHKNSNQNQICYSFNNCLSFKDLNKETNKYGHYRIVAKEISNEKIVELLNNHNIEASVNHITTMNDTDIYIYVALIFIVIMLNILLFIDNRFKYKDVFIINIYSNKLELFKYLYLDNIICYSISNIIAIIILFTLFKLSSLYLLFIFIIVPFIIYLLVTYLEFDYYKKQTYASDVKGKANLRIIYHLYCFFILLGSIFICLLIFIVAGQKDAIKKEYIQANWDLNKHYANLSLSRENAIRVNQISISSIYDKLDEKQSILLDNGSFRTIIESKDKTMFNDIELNKYVDVNYNYVTKYLKEITINKELNNIIITNQQYNSIKNKNDLCLVNYFTKEDGFLEKCNIIKVDQLKVFTNLYNENNTDGFNEDAFIRVLNKHIIKNNDFILNNNTLFIPITNYNNLYEDFNKITKELNNYSLVSNNGDYNALFNKYNDYIDLVRVVNEFKTMVSFILVIFSLLLLVFINLSIKLDITINIKELFIKKCLGYSLLKRYYKFITFIIISLVTSIIITSLIIIISNIKPNSIFYIIMLVNIIITIIFSLLMIKNYDNKAINNILKGEM